MPSDAHLSKDEIKKICSNLFQLGIDEIRLTGGEPSLRADFMDIVKNLSELPLKKLGATSNGLTIKKYLPELRNTNCQYLNFSLDSLSRNGFHQITKVDALEKVLESILMAKELGFEVKVNVVVMKGVNDHELENFVEFSASEDIEVRFLELNNIGFARNRFDEWFLPADRLISAFQKRWKLEPVAMPKDSTSFNYQLSNGAKVGFIASEFRPFCVSCSRLRLSSEGKIWPCLMLNQGFDLRSLEFEDYFPLLQKVMGLKPMDRIKDVERPMYSIGG